MGQGQVAEPELGEKQNTNKTKRNTEKVSSFSIPISSLCITLFS